MNGPRIENRTNQERYQIRRSNSFVIAAKFFSVVMISLYVGARFGFHTNYTMIVIAIMAIWFLHHFAEYVEVVKRNSLVGEIVPIRRKISQIADMESERTYRRARLLCAIVFIAAIVTSPLIFVNWWAGLVPVLIMMFAFGILRSVLEIEAAMVLSRSNCGRL